MTSKGGSDQEKAAENASENAAEKTAEKAKAFTDDIAEKIRAQMDRLKPEPEKIYQIHHNIRRMINQFDMAGPDMARVIDFNVPDDDNPVPVRLYLPYQASQEAGPCLIYLHGGGFVTCSLESHDGIARRIASGSGYRVLSVDYRLAPQFPYPAGPLDCETVLNWALEGYGQDDYGIDRRRLALGGDSAGGNMTAFLTQKYRDNINAQILFYPLMQLVELKPPKAGPQDWLQLGFMALKFIDEHYVAGADARDTRLSPLFETNLKGLPPAFILTCGLDPLRDEGRLYAKNLQANGVLVDYSHEKLLPHGFLNFTKAFPKGRKVPLDAADFLRQHLS